MLPPVDQSIDLDVILYFSINHQILPILPLNRLKSTRLFPSQWLLHKRRWHPWYVSLQQTFAFQACLSCPNFPMASHQPGDELETP